MTYGAWLISNWFRPGSNHQKKNKGEKSKSLIRVEMDEKRAVGGRLVGEGGSKPVCYPNQNSSSVDNWALYVEEMSGRWIR